MRTPDRLSPTLRLVDLLTPGIADQVDPQVLAHVEAALAQVGRTVDRDILLALAGQQQALGQQALVALPAPPAPPILTPTPSPDPKVPEAPAQPSWWARWPFSASSRSPRIKMGSWQRRMARQVRAGQAYNSDAMVSEVAVAYHRIRRARYYGKASNTFSRQTQQLLKGTYPAAPLAPVLSADHESVLTAALASAPGGAVWAPAWCYDGPEDASAYTPLLLEAVEPLLKAFFKSDPRAQRDHQPTDLPLFDTLVRLGVDPDVPFRAGSHAYFPLSGDGYNWPALTSREVLLLACQHRLLARLTPVVHRPTRGIASWLWWVIRARQVQPDRAFSQLLRDDTARLLSAIEATIGWVLAHEDAPHLHRKLLMDAIEHESQAALKAIYEIQLTHLKAPFATEGLAGVKRD